MGKTIHDDNKLTINKLTIDNIFLATAVVEAYKKRKDKESKKYLGLTLFPIRREPGQSFDMYFRDTAKPRVIKGSMPDTPAPIRSGKMFEKITVEELPRFKEAYSMDETRQIKLMQVIETQKKDWILNHIANDYEGVFSIIDGVDAQYERMIMQLLAYGKIDFVSAGLHISYDYNLKADQIVTLTGTDMFSDIANSNPLKLLSAEIKEERDKGKNIGGMILNSEVWNKLLENINIRKKLSPVPGQEVDVEDDMLKKYFKEKLKITPYIYTQTFEDESGVIRKFYPENRITLIEKTKQGFTGTGTTIEEANKRLKDQKDIEILPNGTAIKGMYDPKNESKEMQVSAVGLPVWTKYRDIKILIVQ